MQQIPVDQSQQAKPTGFSSLWAGLMLPSHLTAAVGSVLSIWSKQQSDVNGPEAAGLLADTANAAKVEQSVS